MPKISIDNHNQLYYTTIPGNERKPYLVFLHEGLGCTAMWNDFPKRMCEASGCPGLVYDRLGYGKSSALVQGRTVRYLHDYALRELPVLLEAVIAGKPFILIGHSDGGSISLIYGAERPALLKGIITEAAHVFVEDETLAGIKEADRAWDQGKLRGLIPFHGEKTELMFKAWSQTWLGDDFIQWNIEALLPAIEVPLLVIQGEEDQYGSASQVHAIVSGCGENATPRMIQNCAHTPHVEAQQEVLATMKRFIDRVTDNEVPQSGNP